MDRDQDRQTSRVIEFVRVVNRGKLVAAVMVGAAIFTSIVNWHNETALGGHGRQFVLLVWVANYLLINCTLASHQRITLLVRYIADDDLARLIRFRSVPMVLHVLSLCILANPMTLYQGEGR